MDKKQNTFLKILILILVAIGLSFSLTAAQKMVAEKGVLDLDNWNFAKYGPASLNGEWEIIWDQFIKPDQFESPRNQREFFEVPSTWESEHSFNNAGGHHGFATLRLVVKTGKDSERWVLSISGMRLDFNIYVNGKRVANFGDPENVDATLVDRRHSLLTSKSFSGDKLEIVIHIANYNYMEGGIKGAVHLGPADVVQNYQRKMIGFEMFLFGSILIIGIYHFGNFFFRKTDLASLYFSILCFLFAFRIMLMGSSFASMLFPGLSFISSLVIEFLCIYLSLPVFASFIYHLYPTEFSKRLLNVVVVISLVFAWLVIFYDESVQTVAFLAFEFIAFLTMGYICFVLTIAVSRNRIGAKILIAGFIILYASAINDILFDMGIVKTGLYLSLGMFSYILFQALHLSYRSARQFSNVEILKDKLFLSNSTLEDRVKARTDELNIRNQELKVEIEKHEVMTEELAKAKLQAESANQAKSEFLANMSHELRTPMHGILGFAKFGEEKIQKVGKETLLEFFSEIKMCGERLLILLNDLLDLSKLESGKILYEFQQNDLFNVVNIVLKEFDAVAKQKQIETSLHPIDFDTQAVFDEGKLIQVVRNLVSNAIKFSPEKSKVNLIFENHGEELSLSVVDQGVGIPENELEDVFDKFIQSTKTKTTSGGTGLGLPISLKIISDHRGQIWAANNEEGGSTFTFKIPKKQKAKKKLGEILVEQKLITHEELVNTLKSQEEAD